MTTRHAPFIASILMQSGITLICPTSAVTYLHVPDVSKFDFEKLLPSGEDKKVLHKNVAIMIGCILKSMPFFKKFGEGLEKHILHEFSDYMSTKSEVVRLTLYLQ